MTIPQFRPRQYSVEPSVFGKTLSVRWIRPASMEAYDRVELAKIQNHYSVHIQNRLRARGETIKEFAMLTEQPYDRWSKVLRGDSLITLEEIQKANRILGGIPSAMPSSVRWNASNNLRRKQRLDTPRQTWPTISPISFQ
ncbi:hypothetical protein [Cryobacterium sp. AP23]